MALRRFANGVNVGEVLRSRGCQLGHYEIVARNEKCLQPGFWINRRLNTPVPCRVEIDAGNVGKNIEAVRITSKTKETAALREVFRANALERRAELGEGGIRRLRIREVCFDEKVDVLRKAGLSVKDDGVSAHDEIFNATGMEGEQKVFVVLVHPALFSNL